jgi:hypothetical protein
MRDEREEAEEVKADKVWDLRLGARLEDCIQSGDIRRLSLYILHLRWEKDV